MSTDSTQESILGSARFCSQRPFLRPGSRPAALRASIQSLPFESNDMNDLKFAFRQLRKSPGFTAVAITTLGIGIGASTVIFSALNALLLRPLPVEKPHELVSGYAIRDGVDPYM